MKDNKEIEAFISYSLSCMQDTINRRYSEENREFHPEHFDAMKMAAGSAFVMFKATILSTADDWFQTTEDDT